MKKIVRLTSTVVLCWIVVVVYLAGECQLAGADNAPYGIYVLSTDPTQYIELEPDGRCIVGGREYTPSGKTGKLEVLSGTYGISGGILTLELKVRGGTIKSEFRLEGDSLVPKMKPAPRGLEGAKYRKK